MPASDTRQHAEFLKAPWDLWSSTRHLINEPFLLLQKNKTTDHRATLKITEDKMGTDENGWRTEYHGHMAIRMPSFQFISFKQEWVSNAAHHTAHGWWSDWRPIIWSASDKSEQDANIVQRGEEKHRCNKSQLPSITLATRTWIQLGRRPTSDWRTRASLCLLWAGI